jgi:hypothetical protein
MSKEVSATMRRTTSKRESAANVEWLIGQERLVDGGGVDRRSRKTSAKSRDYRLDGSAKGAVTLSEASQTRAEELVLAVFAPLFSTDIFEIG